MKKTCFVIMPISDNSNYEKGHFERVYDFIIKPACISAGFEPVRADDVLTTNHIALDIINKIIESEMAICDLSSQNPNVLYELGIRQAFNKPVTLIKDYKTNRIFDIQGFRDLEYDENLRIDNVQDTVDSLAEIITNTYNDNGKDINSLVKLLSISPAELNEKTDISVETELILNNLNSLDNRLSRIEESTKIRESKNMLKHAQQFYEPDTEEIEHGERYTTSELLELKKGDKVVHRRFGIGTVLSIDKNKAEAKDYLGTFDFKTGKKRLLLRFASLHKVL